MLLIYFKTFYKPNGTLCTGSGSNNETFKCSYGNPSERFTVPHETDIHFAPEIFMEFLLRGRSCTGVEDAVETKTVTLRNVHT